MSSSLHDLCNPTSACPPKISTFPPCRTNPVTPGSSLPDLDQDQSSTSTRPKPVLIQERLSWLSGGLHSHQIWFYHVHVHFSLLLFSFSSLDWKTESQRTENISLKWVAKDSQVVIPGRRASVAWLNHKLSVMPIKNLKQQHLLTINPLQHYFKIILPYSKVTHSGNPSLRQLLWVLVENFFLFLIAPKSREIIWICHVRLFEKWTQKSGRFYEKVAYKGSNSAIKNGFDRKFPAGTGCLITS